MPTDENPERIAFQEAAAESAQQTRDLFDAFVAVGFSEPQAMEIILAAAAGNALIDRSFDRRRRR